MEALSTIGLVVLVAILTVSSIVTLLIRELAWPPALVRHFRNARRDEIRQIMEELLQQQRAHEEEARSRRAAAIQRSGRYSDPSKRAEQLIAATLSSHADGSEKPFAAEVPFFVDFMSASTDPKFSEECSLLLASYLHNHRADVTGFDAIVGIKPGSPLIASRLAVRLDLPLLLFRGGNRFKRDSPERDPADLFDGDAAYLSQRLLIVDDSTTGGRMMLDCVDAIRRLNGHVTGVLVVFEVMGRNARAELEKNSVPFYTLIGVDAAKVAAIRGTDDDNSQYTDRRT